MLTLQSNALTRGLVHLICACLILSGCGRSQGGDLDSDSSSKNGNYDFDDFYGDGGSGGGGGASGTGNFPITDDVDENGQVNPADLSQLASLMGALSPDKSQQAQNIILAALDDCSFLSGPYNAQARQQCKNGDPRGCASAVLNIGKSHFGNLVNDPSYQGQNIPALINQQRGMCAMIDWSNPQKVQSQLEKLKNGCLKQKRIGDCIGLLLMAVAMFVRGLLGSILGGAKK